MLKCWYSPTSSWADERILLFIENLTHTNEKAILLVLTDEMWVCESAIFLPRLLQFSLQSDWTLISNHTPIAKTIILQAVAAGD